MEKKPARKPRIASVEDPVILACVRGYYKYDHEWQADDMLAKIFNDYLRSKEATPERVHLWVRGYNVTREEKDAHYRGNFCVLTKAEAEAGKWTINGEKVETPLVKHPEKDRPKAAHPNWGHPVLRAVETGKVFPGIEVARAFLMSLHQDFPDATIPGKDVVRVMVYKRTEGEGSPIQKLGIKVKPLADGGAKLMVMKPKVKGKEPPKIGEQMPLEEQGKFTTLIKKSRARKKPS